jgi:acetate kinase
MIVLALNPGSGSLKFDLIAGEPSTDYRLTARKLADGVVEPIGSEATLTLLENRKPVIQDRVPVRDYGDTARKTLQWIDSGRMSTASPIRLKDVDLLACRVVHGGDDYVKPVRVDETLVSAVERLDDLAPLHNIACASVIRAAREMLGAKVPAVAVFDTAFHSTLPERARTYAIPREIAARHGIRRYGFHGLSHQYLLLRYVELAGTKLDQTNIITLHLGGGASATAIRAGKSIDTSMGLTPLEGLVMSTRCGDLDAGVLTFLARKEGLDMEAMEELLNRQSGLLGISGRSGDTRELVKLSPEDPQAQLALDVFAYRAKKYLGAYLAVLGKASAVVLGGVIAENTPEVRRRICEGLEDFGLEFDPERNAATIDREGRITRDGSRLHAYVIPSEEGIMMAQEAMRCWAA